MAEDFDRESEELVEQYLLYLRGPGRNRPFLSRESTKSPPYLRRFMHLPRANRHCRELRG